MIIYAPSGNGWFWSIPLPDDVTSIGLVAPPQELWSGDGDDLQMKFQEAIRTCPGMASRLVNATQIGSMSVTKDFSYRASRMAGVSDKFIHSKAASDATAKPATSRPIKIRCRRARTFVCQASVAAARA